MRFHRQSTYDSATNRWTWIISQGGTAVSQPVPVVRSIASYPTEHDSNLAAKTFERQYASREP